MGDEIADRVRAYLGERNPDARPASFDYCFNYFQGFRDRGNLPELGSPAHLEESCLQLGFYLASWGMLRGSSPLLRKSLSSYVPVVQALAGLPGEVWHIDVPTYDAHSTALALESLGRIRCAFEHRATDTLVTKVALGVLGCIPAFDTDFRRGFGSVAVSHRSMMRLRSFYDEHRAEIEHVRPTTLDFGTGDLTGRQYPVAKVLDMLFIAGRFPVA